MTTSTIVSSISYNQNQGGAVVPAPSIVNAGAVVAQRVYTLTVSPTSGWAKASYAEGTDGVNYPRGGEVFVAPNSGGSAIDAVATVDPPMRYMTGQITEVGPAGATATLTVTY